MIRNFLNFKTRKPLHMHVESEQLGTLTGMLCHADKFYRAVLVEVEPGSGIYERRS